MNIIFFGTPDFAIPSLEIINRSNHKVVAVVTAPDKQRGRGRKVSFTPIKTYATENNIKLLQPEKLKDENFIAQLKNLKADLFVVVAFKILSKEIFTIPKYGSFNLHGSLLPKYRGAAPIQWAIIKGEKETGVTTFFLKEKVDTGNIIDSEKIPINIEDNLGSIHDKLSIKGAELVLKTINKIDSGKVVLTEQDEALSTPAPKINKETCIIDWNDTAENIHNLVRGLSPYPVAFFEYNNKKYKLFKTEIITCKNLLIGEIEQTKREIFIGTGNNVIKVLELQPEGKRSMTTDAFLRGNSLL